jgi:hypothetical protein
MILSVASQTPETDKRIKELKSKYSVHCCIMSEYRGYSLKGVEK